MPKTNAPLLSFDARGQIAKTQVYSSWRGVSYVRRYTVPNNPNTTKQQGVRGVFSFLQNAWLFAPPDVRAPWDGYAVGKPLLGRNAFTKFNGKLLSTDPVATDLTGFYFSPGSLGGLPPTNLVLTPGDDQITVAATAPDAPDGWTLTQAWAAAIVNADPTLPFNGEWNVLNDAAAPYSIILTGLQSATEYVAGMWLEWLKPDGKTAYSVSLSDVATTT